MTPPDRRRDARADFAVPLAVAAVLLGLAPVAILYLEAPSVALAAVILAVAIVLAILRAMLSPGDR